MSLISYVEVRYRQTGEIGWTYMKLDPSATSVTIPEMEAGAEYQVEARSVSECGSASAWTSQTHTIATLTIRPPESLFAVTALDGVGLSWSYPVVLAANMSYQVWFAPDVAGVAGAYELLTTTTTNSFYHSNTTATKYWYKVRVVLTTGESSAFCAELSATPSASADLITSIEDAQSSADAALAELADIVSDSLLTPDEKPRVVRDRDEILAEQSGIDAQAAAFNITTEKTAYDTAITNLTAYLATLTTPTLWSDLSGNTTIVGTTFRSKFLDVYAARQTLLNKIYDEASNYAPVVEGPNSVDLSANYLGVISSGQLPKTLSYTRKKGVNDVSSTTTWSIQSPVSIPTGVPTISSLGVVTIPPEFTMGLTASFIVRSVRDGVTLDTVVTMTKTNAPAPITGTGGGSTVSDSSFEGVSGTSFVAISDLMTVETDTSGTLVFSAPLTTSIVSGGGIFNVELVWRWRTIGGTFADVATAVASEPDAIGYKDIELNEFFVEDGYVDCSPTKTGLAANTKYEVQLFARRTTSSPIRTVYFNGAVTVVGGTGSGGSSGIGSIGSSGPITISGDTTPIISIPVATNSVDGYLSATDHSDFASKANADGSNATGTWPIGVTGKAASVGNTHDATARKVWTGTQAAYNALTKDANTVYHITDAPAIVSDKNYRHVQGTAADTWYVNHGLGKRTSISVVDSSGSTVEGEYQYVDDNNVTLKFSGAFSGEAYFN